MRAVLAVLLVSCTISHKPSSPDADPCAGRGCEVATGQLLLHVVDATTLRPVAVTPTFRIADRGLVAFSCSAPTSPCPSWLVPESPLGIGATFTVEIAASGYLAGDVTVTMPGPMGCCGVGPDVDATVKLAPAAP